MENEDSIRSALRTGEISLQKLLKLKGEKVMLKVFFEYAVRMDTGQKASISNPIEIALKPQRKDEIYGHTLLKEFSHQLGKLKKRRIIQFADVLFINSNLIYEFEGRNFDLARELGLLKLS